MGYTAEDEALIREKWDDLLFSCTKICKNDEDWNFIKRAFFLAKEAHEGVRRRSGEPYLLHPIAVAKIVIDEIGLGVKSVVAALLHDVVEDTEYTVEDMERIFGPKIASMVDGLTKMAGVFNADTSEQAEYFRKVLLTLSDDVRVILIKIADRLRDWISMPKANGYEALHSTVMGPDGVWVEVQIRTQRMEDIAERGFAAHWKYKHATISQDEDEFDKWLKQIRAALNSPTENAVDFLDNFKLSLYTSEIVVFTPKGESRKMPFGATALDFAYDIHSKIGNSAISAKINHKLEPITTQINSGDQIEIITADTARPKPEWLDIVTTAKAKSAIKSFLKRERQNNIERGMQLLEEKMKSLNIQLSGRVLRKIVPIYESNNKEELYSKIGAGIVSLDDLDKVLKVNSKSKILKFWTLFIPQKKEEEGDDTGEIAPPAQPKEPADEPQFEIAECCKPIPGDKVVGYRNPVTGKIIVHKATCDELNRLAAQYGKNIVKEEIKWSQHKAMSYLVTTELRGIDRQGLLLDLAKVVSDDFNINIREVNIHSHDGIFEGSVSLYVKDAESLNAVMDKLRKIKGIDSIKRTIS